MMHVAIHRCWRSLVLSGRERGEREREKEYHRDITAYAAQTAIKNEEASDSESQLDCCGLVTPAQRGENPTPRPHPDRIPSRLYLNIHSSHTANMDLYLVSL